MENALAQRLGEKVAARGGRAYFVGGYVRDKLLGKENTDIDIEVHGIYPDVLEAILNELGGAVKMGANFGIYSVKGYDIDIAMPRLEKATGRGHKDFQVFVDPYLGAPKAARRRDFTINAMMEDVLTGEITDCYDGRKDLSRGVLRHVDSETFVEDPLRVLRAAQFAARFEFEVASETIELSRGMDLTALPAERVMGELEKALLKASKPSVFFRVLREMEQLDYWFPEVRDLIGVEQSPVHHPEGDVWNHTMLVLDQAAKVRDNAADPLGFMLSALAHDFGKVVATEIVDGRIHAIGHETKGMPMVKSFLKRLTTNKSLKAYVFNMVELHMKPNAIAESNAKAKSTNRLFYSSIDPAGLIYLARADHLGRPGAEIKEQNEEFLWERLVLFREMMEKPYVKGEDLVAAGLLPGPCFKEVLDYAHKLRLAGIDKDIALKQTLAYARKK